MKTVFISSPFAGDIDNNIASARFYAQQAVIMGYAPIVPHLYIPCLVDEETNRQLALDICKGLCISADYFWLCGDIITAGMREEMEHRIKHKPANMYRAYKSDGTVVLGSIWTEKNSS